MSFCFYGSLIMSMACHCHAVWAKKHSASASATDADHDMGDSSRLLMPKMSLCGCAGGERAVPGQQR